MELVIPSLILLLAVFVWAFVKVAQLSMAFKSIEELRKSRLEVERQSDLAFDLNLKKIMNEWNPEP